MNEEITEQLLSDEPSEKIKRTPAERRRERKMLVRFLQNSKRWFALAVLAAGLAALCDMLIPQIVRLTLDYALIGSEEPLPAPVLHIVDALGGFAYLGGRLYIPALLIVALAGVQMLAKFTFTVAEAHGAETLVKNMRDALYQKMLALPYAFHQRNRTGDMISRCTSDIETAKNFISEQLTNIFRTILFLILSAVFMFTMNARLAWIALAPMPLLILISLWFHGKIERGVEECDINEGILSALAQENLTGVRVVRAFGQEKNEIDRFAAQNHRYTELWVKMGKWISAFWCSTDVLSGIQVLLVLVFGSVFCVRGRLSAGEFIAFLSYNTMLIWPMRELGRLIAELSKAGVSLDRIFYVMDAEEESDEGDACTPPLDRDISFERVSFAYPGSAPILSDVSFTIEAGSTVGILGGTGSGKSTLMLLLDKLYPLEKESGGIRIGGVDIRKIQSAYLRRNIGLVLQEPFLFSRTLRENIALSREDMNDAELAAVAKAAALDGAIASFARGYDTQVGERGVTLSGGQKQRAAIARTLAKPTPILIFDDSLSAIDTETEEKILESLAARRGKATVILISHRIATLSGADKIIVLQNGRIVEQGSHEELKNANGLYRRIYLAQSGEEAADENAD